MIFIDSNVPMYIIGADHPNKRDAITLLEKLVSEKQKLVTNSEVIQEILHRYTAIKRKDAIQPAIDCLYGFIDDVFPISEKDVLSAKEIVLSYKEISARDALHIAHLKQFKIKTIFSFDQGFDKIPKIVRIPIHT